jgi:hypothetical protein
MPGKIKYASRSKPSKVVKRLPLPKHALAAYRKGLKDGAAAVKDAGATRATVESWFMPGQLEPDEGLLNAIVDDARRARYFGLTVAEVRKRGRKWDEAIEGYNSGYRAGAREEAGPEIEEAEADFEDADAVLREFCKAEKEDPADWKIEEDKGLGSFGEGTAYRLTCGPHREYQIVESEDVLRELALAVVKQDLEQEPEIFNKDFIEQHIDKEKLRDALMSDVTDSAYDSLKDEAERHSIDFMKEHSLDIPVPSEKQVRDFAEDGADEDHSASDRYDRVREQDPESQWIEIGEEPEVEDSDIVEAAEEQAKGELRDPMEYLEGIYGSEAAEQAIRIAGIDIDAAAEEAVDTDGPEHFICHYDGNSHTTKSGFAYWRSN